MAKHDRRKRSSQPPSSRTVTIQLPLPVLGVLKPKRAPWLVHHDRDTGPAARYALRAAGVDDAGQPL